MILVDTSAWYASVIQLDPNHAAAVAWLKQNRRPLITTDYVIDETLSLMKFRGHPHQAFVFGEGVFRHKRVSVHHLTEHEVQRAWEVFNRFRDKEWSFTDCTSKVLIEKLGLTTAFAFDHHFRQFGAVTVVP